MKFACDVMLGKLAKYLRILGFDAAYVTGSMELADLCDEEDPRIFLTRRRRSFAYKKIVHIKAEEVREQLRQIKSLIKPFIDPGRVMGRCISCNLPLMDVNKATIEHRVPEFVFHTYSRFKVCQRCDRVYWAGSHAKHMSQLIEEMTE